ncbi:ESCRT-II complex, vps25 subunit [Poronia punctata]|nr:ESCRT-II complex, vps25 subunit [Poronia punctata]
MAAPSPSPSFTTAGTSISPLSATAQLTPPPLTTTTTTTTTTATTTTRNLETNNNTFQFPREYHFPPFFTRQPNQTTHRSQQSKWAALILSYCAHHRIFKLSPATTADDLFHNRRIGRRLALSDAREILDFMRRDGRAEFVGGGGGGGGDAEGGGGGGGDVVWIYWKTPEEWAALIEAWVDDTAQKGTVLTLYELSEGEDTIGTEFHGLDLELLQKALQVLVKRGKAQIFGQDDQLGVKFF